MSRSTIERRLAAIEARSAQMPAVDDAEWSQDDWAFFHVMFARAQQGDRNWSDNDRERYHALLLGEAWSQP